MIFIGTQGEIDDAILINVITNVYKAVYFIGSKNLYIAYSYLDIETVNNWSICKTLIRTDVNITYKQDWNCIIKNYLLIKLDYYVIERCDE